MGSGAEPADAILELILSLEQEASKARGRLRKSLRRLGFESEMTTAQLEETLRTLGAEAPPLIERPDSRYASSRRSVCLNSSVSG
jgi:hypothetical protein